jgi:DNA repair exonuclease SbcCD ATPase subunit
LLQFQYLALIRYCQNTYATRKPLQDALAEAESKLAAMQDLVSKEHAKVLSLQQQNERLKAIKQESRSLKTEVARLQDLDMEVEQYRRLDVNPKDLETFKNNKDAIRHYLKLVPILIGYAPLADSTRPR